MVAQTKINPLWPLAAGTSPARFHFPFEHGAWWTFHISLLAGLIQALAHSASITVALSLALGMEALFLASDWITGLVQLFLIGQLRGRSDWRAPLGWFLSGLAVLCFAWPLRILPGSAARGIAQAYLSMSLGVTAVLWMRVKLRPRDIRLLMVSALLLSLPVLLLGSLAFGGFGPKVFEYWSLWAWFFAWGVYYVQAWMRGTTLPRWRMEIASFPYIAQAIVLGAFSGWPGAVVLGLLSLRVIWRLRFRLNQYTCLPEGAHLPTNPAEIRKLGFEQVFWTLVLSVIWVWRFWPQSAL